MRLGMEMTKKELEKKVAELEQRLMELQSQVLTLSLRQNITIVPAQPISAPPMPTWPPFPYVGDVWPYQPTTTCSAANVGYDAVIN